MGNPAASPDAEQELLRALAKKYENHRGTGDDAKWTVLLREFNARVVEASQKTEAALKRAMKKLSQEPENAAPIAEPKEEDLAEASKNEVKVEGAKKGKNK